MAGASALIVLASAGSLSALSTAVCAAALMINCGATARTVAASESGREKSACNGSGLSKSSATTSPSGASERCNSQPT